MEKDFPDKERTLLRELAKQFTGSSLRESDTRQMITLSDIQTYQRYTYNSKF